MTAKKGKKKIVYYCMEFHFVFWIKNEVKIINNFQKSYKNKYKKH